MRHLALPVLALIPLLAGCAGGSDSKTPPSPTRSTAAQASDPRVLLSKIEGCEPTAPTTQIDMSRESRCAEAFQAKSDANVVAETFAPGKERASLQPVDQRVVISGTDCWVLIDPAYSDRGVKLDVDDVAKPLGGTIQRF